MKRKKPADNPERPQCRAAKTLLASLGWTQKDLCEKTGLELVTVSHVLAGQYKFWPAKAAINAALGRDVFTKPDSKKLPKLPPLDRMVRQDQVITRVLKPKQTKL
jgi:transcriptional regulator with XRE-family HTH domain